MRTGRNRRSGARRPVGLLLALGIVSGLFAGCGDSAEQPADASLSRSAAATPSEQPTTARSTNTGTDTVTETGSASAASRVRDKRDKSAQPRPHRAGPLPRGTTEVSITAEQPTAPVLLAPGLAEPPSGSPSLRSKEPGADQAEQGDDTAEFGPVDAASAEAFDALAAAYRDHKPADYESAEGRLVARGAAALPVLLKKLTDPHAETRELASMMVLRIVPETILVDVSYPFERRTAVLARLETALEDPSADVRANVASTLALFPEDIPGVLPALRKLLAAEMPYQRLMAAVAIGNLGPKAAAATSDVAKLLDDGDADVRTAAEQTLELIRPLRSDE